MENNALRYSTMDDSASAATFWETVDSRHFPGPERNLMLAVLKAAIRDFMRRSRLRDARFREACDWLFNREKNDIFAFESVCEVLRLSPAKIRSRLMQLIEEKNGRKCKIGERRLGASMQRAAPSPRKRRGIQRRYNTIVSL